MQNPQMAMPGEMAAPGPAPEEMAIYDRMRQELSPQEFSNEMLAGASQVDPQAVAEFTKELQGLDIPPEALDALNDVVDDILANPEQYDEKRAQYIADGLPEDILPEQFDPEFFAALNMAIDQMIAAPTGVQAFAKGGIAELKPIAKAIASYGRNGDTMLAHITPAEARMLRRRGGSGTINPDTGLPEFFLKKLFKSVGKAFKSIGRAVKKFVSSKIGRLVATVALGFFLGPAAASMLGATSAAGVAAVSGFIGSAGSTLLAGGNLKDALKAGAIGGLTAGAGAGIMGGAGAFQAGSYTGPTTIGGQFDRFKDAIGFGARPAGDLAPVVDAPASVPGAGASAPVPTPGGTPASIGIGQTAASPVDFGFADDFAAAPPAAPAIAAAPPTAAPATAAPAAAAPAPGPYTQAMADTPALAPVETMTGTPNPNYKNPPPPSGPLDSIKKFYSENISPSGIKQAGAQNAATAADNALAAYVKANPGASQAARDAVFNNALKAATPGALATYGPAMAAGLGIMGLTGGFTPKQPELSPTAQALLNRDEGRVKIEDRPDLFYIQGLPGVKYDERGAIIGSQPWSPSATMDDVRVPSMSSAGGNMDISPPGLPFPSLYTPGLGTLGQSPQVAQQFNNPYMYANLMQPRRYAGGGGVGYPGGLASLAQGGYPRRTGQISGPGTEKSDSIPAMLSDGEFVMTAKAVRGAGGGSRRAGAKKMYALMHQLERNASRG